ncbi:MAG: hypothetical protein LBP35_04200 [Candidatus Ancillula trichonymphae]|jgi:hypothetical protein|nr:hypothetical protein [Candidatus Ancillula trichonymphae]
MLRTSFIQAGTPEKPLLDGNQFATLRCGNDNSGGDNVEQVRFDAGVKHIYCYYFVVRGLPSAAKFTLNSIVPSQYAR